MRVLWFTNFPMPAVDRRTGKSTRGSGYWMRALIEELRTRPDIELGVATIYPRVPPLDFVEDGVRYFVASQPRIQPHMAYRARDLSACLGFVEGFHPDLIHVHGSERFFGLLSARGMTSVPMVISLQGFPTAYLPTFFGALGATDIIRAQRLVEVLTLRGLLWGYREYARGAVREREILERVPAFMGRTKWDLAQVKRFQPNARYLHVDELLRPEFSESSWSLDTCNRDRVFVTNVGHPRRGTETLLDAAAMLVGQRPGLELHFAGGLPERSGYGRFLRRRISALNLSNHVKLHGYLEGPALVRELLRSRAYAITSFAENSPNSLCEAMSLGLPCVASYAGGIPSLVEEGQTGLFFPPGDAALLAQRLEELLSDDALAVRLGAAARRVAIERHAPARVVGQLMDAYRAVAASGSAARSSGEGT